jgi:tetratricopeptide (TPR) repeat protein
MFVFVIMPFKITGLYEEILKPSLEAEGCTVERGDTHKSQRNIVKRILEKIEQADLIVADLTEGNPNVFYELAVAHAFLKPTFMITQEDLAKLPFDLRAYDAFQYSFHHLNVAELKGRLTDLVKLHRANELTVDNPVTDFLPNYRTASRELTKLTEERDALMRNFRKTLTFVEDSINRSPNVADMYAVATQMYRSLNEYDKALIYARSSIRTAPHAFAPYSHVIGTHIQAGKWQDVVTVCFEALDKVTDSRHIIYLLLGDAYDELGKLEQAQDAYQKSINNKPNNAEAPDKYVERATEGYERVTAKLDKK